MKFRLEATPGELHEKGGALVEELAKAFSGINPDLAEALEKALPAKEQELKHPALQGLKKRTDKEYAAMLKRMNKDIGKVLDQSVSGSSFQKSVVDDLVNVRVYAADGTQLESIEHSIEHHVQSAVEAIAEEVQGACDHVEHMIEKGGTGLPPPEAPEKDEELGTDSEDEAPLEPGDYDPKADEIVPEPAEEEEEEEGEEKSLEKGGPFLGKRGGKWKDAAHTIPWKEPVSEAKARSIARAADRTGKHGKEQQDYVYDLIQGEHVRVTVPVSALDTDEIDSDRAKKLVAEYAKRDTTPPPASVLYGPRSEKRGRKQAFVADGNHRVKAARQKGHTHIEVMMPKEDWDRFKKIEKSGPFMGPKGGEYADAAHTIPWHGGDKTQQMKSKLEAMKTKNAASKKQLEESKARVAAKKEELKTVQQTPSKADELKAKIKKVKAKTKKIEQGLAREDRAEKSLEKSGPFLGPHGGKWADAAHTIPWKESTTKSPSEEALKVKGKLQVLFPGMFVGVEVGERGYQIEFAPTPPTAGPLERIQTDRRVQFTVSPGGAVPWPDGVAVKMADPQTKEQLGWMNVKPPRKAGMTGSKAGEAVIKWFAKHAEVLKVGLKKSDSSQAEPLAHDHTKTIADKDGRAYERVKSALQKKGYSDADFAAGGTLYGHSVNQLIELSRSERMAS